MRMRNICESAHFAHTRRYIFAWQAPTDKSYSSYHLFCRINLRKTDALAGKATLSKLFRLLSEKGSILKRTDVLSLGRTFTVGAWCEGKQPECHKNWPPSTKWRKIKPNTSSPLNMCRYTWYRGLFQDTVHPDDLNQGLCIFLSLFPSSDIIMLYIIQGSKDVKQSAITFKIIILAHFCWHI